MSPCLCTPDDDSVHGFMLRDGKREGMYLAARFTSGGVRWLDLAVSAGFGLGTIALRAWIDVETRLIRGRVLAPNEAEVHPALTLGAWLNRVEVSALAIDIDVFTTEVVLGDDRLVAHLCDFMGALSPTALAAPPQRR